MSLWSFQGARELEPAPQRTPTRWAGLSKLNSVRNIEVDVVLGVPAVPTAEAIQGSGAYRNELPDSLERR
jgi:hypothetical protein